MNATQNPEQGSDGRSIGRRTLLKGVGAAATTAAVGGVSVGSAAAQESDANYDTLTDSGIGSQFVTESGAAMGSMMMFGGPLGTLISDGDASITDLGSDIADWFVGPFTDTADAQQMQASTYYHLRDINDKLGQMYVMQRNNIDNARSNAIAEGVNEIANDLESGNSESAAVGNARQAVLDYMATYERNAQKIWESTVMRVVNLRDRETVVYGDRTGYSVTIKANDQDITNGGPTANYWTVACNVELINGEPMETRAFTMSPSGTTNPETVTVNPYLSDNTNPTLGSNRPLHDVVQEYSVWSDEEYARMTHRLSLDESGFNPGVGHVTVNVDALDSNNPEFNVFKVREDDNQEDSWADLIHSIRYMSVTLADEIATMAQDIYAAYNAGDLATVQDIITPFVRAQNLAMEWRDTGHFGYAAGYAEQIGMSTSLRAEMDVVVREPDGSDADGNTVYASEEEMTGNIVVDEESWREATATNDDSISTAEDVPTPEFAVGEAYSPPGSVDKYGHMLYVANKDGMKPVTQNQEVLINKILDADGREQDSVSADDSNQQEIDIDNLEQRLAERLDTQQEITVDIQGGGGGGDGSGGGVLGLSDRQLAGGAAGAGIVAYLMGKGGGKAASLHPATR